MPKKRLHPLENKVKAFCGEIGLDDLLSSPDARALAAVSGGVDSMVMLSILHKLGYPLDVATCNFSLRPEASHEVVMVKEYCDRLGVPFFTRRFQLAKSRREGQESVQMAARRHRYRWFSELLLDRTQTLQVVLTAHHRDDEVETILLNLFKYKHVELIRGIQPLDSIRKALRPMLSCTKEEIRAYAQQMQIPFSEDSSNAENKYLRNLIRNKLVPVLKEINPDVAEHVIEWKERQEVFLPLRKYMKDRLASYVKSLSPYSDLSLLNSSVKDDHPDDWREMLHFKFRLEPYETRKAICELMDAQPGKSHHSAMYNYTRVHEGIEWGANNITHSARFGDIWEGQLPARLSFFPHYFEVEQLESSQGIDFQQEGIHYLDYDKIHFPVKVRLWEHGDRMRPLGMKGRKKISDILVDLHVPVTHKSEWAVFEDQKQIICLPGFRISEEVRVDENTTRVLKVSIRPVQFI